MDKIILCDGDCGNYWEERYINVAENGYNLCKECMFIFVAEHDQAIRRDEELNS